MNIIESLRIAFRSLLVNKTRAFLTMLGIVIGVAAVIALMAAGNGVQQYITDQFQSVGTNLLFVAAKARHPGAVPSRPLTVDDARAISDSLQAPDVLHTAPVLIRTFPVSRGQNSIMPTIAGVTEEYNEVRQWEIAAGRAIEATDIQGKFRVAVLGQQAAKDLFPKEEWPIGQTIKIKGIPFKVIGLLTPKGGSSFGNEDNTVLIPLTTAQTRLSKARTARGQYTITLIYVQAVSKDRMAAARQEITEILRQQHNIQYANNDDFEVISQEDLISIFGEITGMLTIFLGAIAAISLLVGGIGIMNIMLVSVTERTREIGLRKAVGARRRDILGQFLIEAMVLSLMGGVIGILLGVAGAMLVSTLVNGLHALVTPSAVLLATGFSAGVGLFFGIYPATRAARLNPIDALRYE